MDESFAWKIVYIGVIFSLLVLGIALYFISPQDSTYFNEERTEKVAEFKDTRVEGRKEGKKVWEFYAKEGWTSKDREITTLLNVSRGRIYKSGKLTIKNLFAPWARVYRRSQIAEIFGIPQGGQGPSQLRAVMDLEKFSSRPKDKPEWTRLTADYIKFYPEEKKSEMAGKVVLKRKNSAIFSDRINIDHENKIADMSGNVRIKKKDSLFSADSARYQGENEQMDAMGSVKLDLKEKKIKTFIKSNSAMLFNDEEKDITLSGSIEAVQGKKLAIASEGYYSKKQKGLFLKGGTKAIFEKARAILKEETVKKLNNPDVKNVLKEKTVVTSDNLFFSTDTGNAKADGHVVAAQKTREAKSDSAIYDDKKEILTLSGNVSMKKEETWIKCEQVIVFIQKEVVEATGSAEAKFKL